MTVWAGVDIGNATTEIVLALDAEPLVVIAAGRTPTRGAKGSLRAIEGAARLADRLAKSHDVTIDRAAFAPTRPVDATVSREVQNRAPTGRLTVAARAADTTAGDGTGVGVPVHVDDLISCAAGRPVVVCATQNWGYREVAEEIRAAIESKVEVVAVLTANDEAVLISNRLPSTLPVMDCVDVGPLLTADLVAVEVRGAAAPLRQLTDPFWLVDAFALREDERGDARAIADRLFDSACAVVSSRASVLPVSAPPDRQPPEAHLADRPLIHLVDLADIAADAGARRGTVNIDAKVSATIDPDGPEPAGCELLAEAMGIPVTRVESEAEAARVGALTTPGVTADSLVVDVGGGTVDVIAPEARVVLPGAGQMLTAATSAGLNISRSAAEHAKRGGAVGAVTSQLVEDEQGRRRFLDTPLDGRLTGWLLASAPTGLIPFTARLSVSEWRAWRLAAKRHIVGDRVVTGVELADAAATNLVLVGGGAGDDELARAVSEHSGIEVSVGRGDIGGRMGHRFAVAYGLIIIARQEP